MAVVGVTRQVTKKYVFVVQDAYDQDGQLKQIQLDLGQVISATPRLIYPNDTWAETYNNQLPTLSAREILIEYTAHPQACFHLTTKSGNQTIKLSEVESADSGSPIQPEAHEKVIVTLRVVERSSGRTVPVKLHMHGEWGEYLAALGRHAILNPAWFEDYCTDFIHIDDWSERLCQHSTTYIPDETRFRLPLGKVFVEISKGFEIKPVRKVVEITAETQVIVIEIEKALHWREKGWVTADTHVHFLSPITAMLEGSAEGVNVINLLASQWGELMTNVGEIDGIEMTSWNHLYNGINPYSVSDWYRYLNCGYMVPAVGGTDKMAACTAVGTVRTYVHIDPLHEFDYENWKKAV